MTTTALPAQTDTPTRRRFTVDEYCAMADAGILAEDERLELLDGEIFVMPPIGEPHEFGTDLFNRELTHRLYDRALVRVQNSIRLDDYGLPEPDIAVVRFRDDYHRNRPTPADVLLVIEVADSSLRRDHELKLPHYAAAGIPEVWIVFSPTSPPARWKPSMTPLTACTRAVASSPPTVKSAPGPSLTWCLPWATSCSVTPAEKATKRARPERIRKSLL